MSMKGLEEPNKGALRGNEVASFTLGPLSDLMPKHITLCPSNYHVIILNVAQLLTEMVYGGTFSVRYCSIFMMTW